MSAEELLAWLAGQSAKAKRHARQNQASDLLFGTYCGQAEAYTATAQHVSRMLQLPGDGRTGGEAHPSSPPVVSYVPRLTCPECGEASMHVECG